MCSREDVRAAAAAWQSRPVLTDVLHAEIVCALTAAKYKRAFVLAVPDDWDSDVFLSAALDVLGDGLTGIVLEHRKQVVIAQSRADARVLRLELSARELQKMLSGK